MKGITGQPQNLLRYFKLEDGKGNTAKDEMGKGNATLKNMDTNKAWIKR